MDDARRALNHGFDAVVLSNHGGRQLASLPSPLEVLPAVIDAVRDKLEVLVDGGVRRGSDIVKARAMGAKAVLLGRAPLFGLAATGSRGVSEVLQILREEYETTLRLLGHRSSEMLDSTALTDDLSNETCTAMNDDNRLSGGVAPIDSNQADEAELSASVRSSLFVGSTEKTFRVLEAFNGAQRRMTLADIARRAQLDRSATQRAVHTLEALGYLRRIPDTRTYGLTPKVLHFSYNYIRGNELIDKASPYLLDISRTIGETTNLHELDGVDIVFVARFPGKHLVNIDIAVGSRLPVFFTASGTAILSRLPDARRQEILRGHV